MAKKKEDAQCEGLSAFVDTRLALCCARSRAGNNRRFVLDGTLTTVVDEGPTTSASGFIFG